MLYITLLLFVTAGKEDIFNEYEEKVLPILARYNGTLLYRIRPGKEQHIIAAGEYPYEIHVVSFKTPLDFEQYKMDEERLSYSHLFKESVYKTLMTQGMV